MQKTTRKDLSGSGGGLKNLVMNNILLTIFVNKTSQKRI